MLFTQLFYMYIVLVICTSFICDIHTYVYFYTKNMNIDTFSILNLL